MRALSSSACPLAIRLFWHCDAPPQPWRGSWPVPRALPERYRCRLRTWDISACSFIFIVVEVPAFVTFAFWNGVGDDMDAGSRQLHGIGMVVARIKSWLPR